MTYFELIAGTLILFLGGDFLVRGAIDLALRFKISVLVVGLTVVSFATSAPELLISVNAAFDGHVDISFGNVVGSNIANIALILGLTAIILPITIDPKTYELDWWTMILMSVVLFLFILWDKVLTFWESLVLVTTLIGYNFFTIKFSRKSSKPEISINQHKLRKPWMMIACLLGGSVGLKYGSDLLIDGAVKLASQWEVSERVIGITVVSIGTSLPELAASIIASIKGQQDLSLGNLIGSNIFNILAVLGITGLITKELRIQSPELLYFDFPSLFAISILLYLLMRYYQEGIISRKGGFILLLAYCIYIYFVFKSQLD